MNILHINTFTNKKFVFIVAALCCLLWGSAYPSIKIGYTLFNISSKDIASEILFAGYRFAMAGIIVLVIAKLSGKKIFGLSKKNIFQLFILGITQTALQYIFFYIGLSNTTGVKGSIMNATGTFFSVILAHYIYKNDKLNTNKAVGCIIGFLGVMIINFSGALLKTSFVAKGDGFIILAAFIFSGAAIYGKRLTKTMDVTIVTGYNLFIGGISLTLIGMFSGGQVYHFNISALLLLIYMAILSAAAFSLWTMLLKYNKVGQVAIFNFLIPVFGVILSSIFLGENIMSLKNMLALIFVSLGIWLVSREPIGRNGSIG